MCESCYEHITPEEWSTHLVNPIVKALTAELRAFPYTACGGPWHSEMANMNTDYDLKPLDQTCTERGLHSGDYELDRAQCDLIAAMWNEVGEDARLVALAESQPASM